MLGPRRPAGTVSPVHRSLRRLGVAAILAALALPSAAQEARVDMRRALHANPGLPVVRVADLPHGETLAAGANDPALWRQEQRIVDVRYDGARDVATEIGSGSTSIDLPFSVLGDGKPFGRLRIGAGYIQLEGPSGPGPRIDVLAGDGVRVAGPVLLDERPLQAAVRWNALALPGGGTATAELMLDRSGRVAIQYLVLPQQAGLGLRAGTLRSSAVSRFGSLPAPATSYELADRSIRFGEPDGPQAPAATGPPPAGCNVPVGTWCDIADGQGTTMVYLRENFDDGLSTSRGWLADDQWHEITFDTCPPGATFDPGVAWYYGQDTTCQYLENGNGILESPQTALPISSTTQIDFRLRIQKDESPPDRAEVYVNGVGIVGFDSTGADPNAWYEWTITSAQLSASWGTQIIIDYLFVSDSLDNGLGWGIDDVVVYDPNTAINSNCVISAGVAGNTPCEALVDDSWQFFENAFCQQCTYTFYALVECGREMHLPLLDMEGGDVTVTHVLTNQRAPLTCRNSTWYANRGLGPYRGYGQQCCPLPAPGDGVQDVWYGPEFEAIDPTGHVRWGLDESCPSIAIYDTNGNGAFDCGTELPCPAGELPLLSPGEFQVMDCFVQADTGLCGIYRIDVTSGGFAWNLFANCTGGPEPQFPIFFDCTDAWTAYNPLPEIAVQDLSTTGNCFPDLLVSFDIINIGCAPVPPGTDVIARISSNCPPPTGPDVANVIVPDPEGDGLNIGEVESIVDFAFPPSCQPVRIEVSADPTDPVNPDGLIAECTESITVASCRQEEGVDSLATFTCGCTANLDANPGPDSFSCGGELITLDGSSSVVAPCAFPNYQWSDANGIIQPFSRDPDVVVPFAGCPTFLDYTLEVQCETETCVDAQSVRVTCLVPDAQIAAVPPTCVGQNLRLEGGASDIPGCADIVYSWFNPLGTQVQTGSTETLNLGAFSCDEAGTYRLEVQCATGGSCFDVATVDVVCIEAIGEILQDTMTTCQGQPFQVLPADITTTTTSNCTAQYRWFDGVSGAPLSPDADGDTVADYSADPTSPLLSFVACPASGILVLETTCAEVPTCGTLDAVQVDCPRPLTPVPTFVHACGGAAVELDCGVSEAGITYFWDTDTSVDGPDADADPANDLDLVGCGDVSPVRAVWPTAATRTVRAIAVEPSGCRSVADLEVSSVADPLTPAPTYVPDCAGALLALTCGVVPPEPDTLYSWDFDIFTDSDADGRSDNDADAGPTLGSAGGCDVSSAYPAGGASTRVFATASKPGGVTCTTTGDVFVTPDAGTIPAEVPADTLRVTRAAATLSLRWGAATDATTYRVLRGLLLAPFSYDHDADVSGRGACDTAAALTLTDPDDGSDGVDYYYLVIGVGSCGADGTAGFGMRDVAFERPPRTAAPDACP